ncbi:2'-5' RNA ligase [Neobacillus bataviensis LMG 21833]|uniref:RNA 2',3'-cyclic phosphodiesterase n=1 Tax=Neobacillus bataviensis LMG 21833 TaxID=1117379 RepID=K6DD99_9BACI|nr:RNA 2',3'-cyclic phosphodiesterase [Neobacillus bataviensis]EKN66018.1 2'-5' RNA ligase [Neobacillus bataviensis LMG 21833]
MEQRSHFFFAVRIPDETKRIMKNHIEKMRDSLPFSRWVHHQDLHITLAFLGAADPEKLAEAEKIVKQILKEAKAFPVKMHNLGIFGHEDSPRIFWVDTEESAELKAIRNKVFSACEKAGFQLETRPFRPHITLARKWNGAQPFQKELLELWKELQSEALGFLVSEIILYQTHLKQTPKYEAIITFPFQT